MDADQRARVQQAYREWSGSYDRLMRRTYQRVERAISRVHLLRHLPHRPEGRLLDAGGGDGVRSAELIRDGKAGRAVVLDVSPHMLELARRRRRDPEPIDLALGDVCTLPFPDDSFDLVVALGGVASHCPQHGHALRELGRVTRRGGHLVVSVDGLAAGLRAARLQRRADLLDDLLATGTARIFHLHPYPFDVHFFTPDELREGLGALGGEVLSLIGKPVLTGFTSSPGDLPEHEIEARVEAEMGFVSDPRFLPHADQLEAIVRI